MSTDQTPRKLDFLTDHFVSIAYQYMEATGLTVPGLSHLLFSQGSRFNEIEAGERRLRADNLAQALFTMSATWPEDAKFQWPEGPLRRPRVSAPSRKRQLSVV